MKSVRKRLTYANVMSSIAVFLVVAGGTAFAATQLGKESVGTKQLKKEAVSAWRKSTPPRKTPSKGRPARLVPQGRKARPERPERRVRKASAAKRAKKATRARRPARLVVL